MNKNEMTIKQFRALPHRDEYKGELTKITSLVVLPGAGNKKALHDSGYRCMEFVPCNHEGALCRISGCSDVIHIEGIGGLGKDWIHNYAGYPKMVPPTGWSVDCLPKSGLLQFFPSGQYLTCDGMGKNDYAVSSFQVYADGKRK